MCASTDLWEPRAGNRPGPPGRQARDLRGRPPTDTVRVEAKLVVVRIAFLAAAITTPARSGQTNRPVQCDHAAANQAPMPHGVPAVGAGRGRRGGAGRFCPTLQARLRELPQPGLELFFGVTEVLQFGRQPLQEFVELPVELFPLLRGEYTGHRILSGC